MILICLNFVPFERLLSQIKLPISHFSHTNFYTLACDNIKISNWTYMLERNHSILVNKLQFKLIDDHLKRQAKYIGEIEKDRHRFIH